MYLQALEINGFKSFANKTRLVFEPGITAIVGPNGCGKSNVSDAIRWVLGEQRASALRGGAMTDVIFNGTDDHKPLGMAEVSITFADCSGALGLEYEEVTVTRRVFRTGEGQYFINKTPCRLRDIQRLFMDTGIGTTSYSVMAQGQIDAILSSRPEDRRAIFEEASGITRFRADRREAIRKLDATDQNLARLADVIAELRRQIASLQRQASRARRYKELQTQLRKIDLYLASLRLADLNARGRSLAEAFEAAQSEGATLRDAVEKAEAGLEELRRAVAEAEQGISAAVETAASAHNARAQADEKLRGGALRIAENRAWKERDEEELRQTEAVKAAQEKLHAEVLSRLAPLDEALAAAQAALDEARSRFDSLHGDSDEARAALQRLRDQSVELERANARLQNELSAAEAADRESILRHERLSAEKTRLEASVKELSARLDDVSGEVETLQGLAESHSDAALAAERKLASARAGLDEARATASSVRADLAACQARLKLLEEAASSSEGLPAGAAELLDAANPLSAPAGAVLGPLAERFSAPKEFRTALQAVLRAWLDAVAVRSGEDAAALAALLVSTGGSHPARLVAADGGAAGGAPADTASSEPQWSSDVSALRPVPLISLVDVEKGFEAAAQRLIGRAYLVDALPPDPAAVPQDVALVTRGGAVVRGGGLYDLWSADGAAANPFARQAQLEDARADESRLSDAAAEAEEGEARAADAIRAAEDALSRARTLLDQSRRAAAQKEGEERSLSRDLSDARARLRATSSELDSLATAAKAATDRARDLSARIHDMGESRTRLADAVAAQSDAARRAESEFLAAQGALTDARLAHAAAAQASQSARSQAAAVAARVSELGAMAETRSRAVASYAEAIARLEAEASAVTESLPALDDAARAADGKVAELRAARAARQEEADKAAAALVRRRTALDEAAARRTQAEVALAEARVQMQNLEEGLQRDWHLTVEELGREEPPDWGEEGAPSMEIAAERVAELRQKMENMGPVNLVAIEDCQKSEERLDFLVGQESDLVQAKEKLMALIKDIDRQSVARFRETFTKANENFQKMYTRLFGGGTAELRLMDDENVLECGIDIVARPPGKKPTSVSLLSGGERTMTAVALLFSIYEIKPSPFAILDELDAALDDSNIGRFVDVLKDFLSLSQFLIITHNQHTIAGSDIVYGVTQQEKGVSTIISMRLKRVGVEELKGETLPELETPKGPSERKLRNAENYVKKPKKPKTPPQAAAAAPEADGADGSPGRGGQVDSSGDSVASGDSE